MAATELLYGIALARVAAVDVDGGVPDTPTWQALTGVQQAQLQAQYSQGQSTETRGDDRLLAVVQEDDQYTGCDLTLQNANLDLSVLPTVVGGTYNAGPPKKWEPRGIGTAAPRFILELYVARYGEGTQHTSDLLGYDKYTFSNCTATGPDHTLQDRNWSTPSFNVRARDNVTDGLRFMSIEEVAALPV